MRKKEEEIRDLILSGETTSEVNFEVFDAIDKLKTLINECDYDVLLKRTAINKLDGIKMMLGIKKKHIFHGLNSDIKRRDNNKRDIKSRNNTHHKHGHNINNEHFEEMMKRFKVDAKKETTDEKVTFSSLISNLTDKFKCGKKK